MEDKRVELKRLLPLLILTLAIFFSGNQASATHLMGGEATYRFLGIVNGNYQYEIKFSVYVDWDSTANAFYQNNGGFIPSINYGVYNTSNNALFVQGNIPNTDTAKYIPSLPVGCNVPGITSLKITLNTFIDTINLPGPFSEYSFMYQNCCRNSSPLNIVAPQTTGIIMANLMSPNFVENSSPQFTDPAVPFLCQGDTTTFSNNAIDPDGDFLVYKFISNTQSVGFGVPTTFDFSTIPNTQYPANFSVEEPFGPGGYAFINSANGLTKYYAPNAGEYTITIEIEEYRDINNDGIDDLIGTTRRELQFVVRPCAPNDAPVAADIVVNGMTVPNINGTVDIDINEGDVLNFSVNVADPNNDSLEIFMEGDILDGTNGYTGPLATFPGAAGNGLVSSNFSWSPTCGITGQFLVRLTLNDFGCPPKSDLVFYNINVRPFESASTLFIAEVGESPDSICFDNQARNYFTTKNPTALKQWQATGGTINGSTTSDTVSVTWNSVGTQTLSLIETSALGCSDTAEFDVVVVAPDIITASSDTIICPTSSAQLLASGSSQGYIWSPSLFLDNPNIANPLSTPDSTTIYLVKAQGGLGCSNTDTVVVEVSTNEVQAGTTQGVCHGDTIQLGGIPADDVEYSWNPGTLLNDSTLKNPFLIAENLTSLPIVQQYILTGVDSLTSCTLVDSVDITIYPLPIANAGVPDTLCSNSSTNIGTILSPTQTCVWSTSQFLADSNSCITTVTPFTNLTVNESFTFIMEVTDGPLGCINYDTVEIIAKPLPRVFAGNDTVICSDQLIALGDSGETGFNYSWITTATTPVVPTQSPNPVQFFTYNGPNPDTTFQSQVTAINTDPNNLCVNVDFIQVQVNRLPEITIIPDTSICSQESIQVGGSALTAHDYTWNTSFGLSDSTVSNPTLNVNNPTDSSQFYSYQVVVTNTTTGCIDSLGFDAEIRPLPISDAGLDIAICSSFSDTIGTAATPNYTYSWSPTNGLSSTTVSNPIVTLTTGQFPDSSQYVVTTELDACFTSDTITVTVNPVPQVDTIFGGISICPDLQDVQYYIIDSLGFINYQWFAVGGTVEAPSNNDTVIVDWGPANPNAGLFVIPTNAFGCSRDTTSIDIVINSVLTSPPPIGDTSVCLGTAQNLLYAVPFTTGYTYNWSSPSINHTLLPVGNGSQVLYTFNEAGVAQIFVEQTVTTVTSTCLGFSDTLTVIVHPDPLDTLPILGDTSLCAFSSAAAYQVNGFPNSTYAWSLNSGGTLTADTSNSAIVDWDGPGSYTLSVFETSEFGCTSGSIPLEVTINPLPDPQWNSFDSTICPGTEDGNQYSVTGFANSSFVWKAFGGNITNTDSLDTQTINWDISRAPLRVSVFEITEFGCTDDSLVLGLLVDSSMAVIENVTLLDPSDTFSIAELRFNDGQAATIADTLVIERQQVGSPDWITIAQVRKGTAIIQDTELANRIDNAYNYRITTDNLCGLQTESLPHNSLKLQGEAVEDEDRVRLNWNAYINWPLGVQEYQIFRKLDTQSTFELYQTTSSVDYTDFSANDAFDHTFYIKAIEAGGANESNSNAFKLEFENLPFIANVITPNNDGDNDTWKIDNRELYGVVKVQVVDRYGNIIYQSENYQNDWDGGELNPGTYFYVVQIEKLDLTSQGPLMILR